KANTFSFRQDSTFLYYWGLDDPSLAAIIDIDTGNEIMFGDDPTVDEIVWTGPQTRIRDKAAKAGVGRTMPQTKLGVVVREAAQKGRKIHFLRQYRADNLLKVESLVQMPASQVNASASVDFHKAVVAQRSVKSKEEVEQIEIALDITREMQIAAMKMSRPGMYEREVAGAMNGIAIARGGDLAFPIIFSVHGETLHNHHHGNKMKRGDIVVNDSGAESSLHYAGDITRTFPVSGKFNQRQREIYQLVLQAQKKSIGMIAPGVKYLDVHLTSCRALAAGLKDLGLMKGDTEEAVREGAHAMFFQCGTGHMMGLDVHDMENLGEEFIGYDDQTKRNSQFGLCYLRMAKALQPGNVVTVEPGIYFIPELYKAWKSERKHEQYLNYPAIGKYMDFGGVRIEDDILVMERGFRVLGKKIPKTISDVEAMCS
ncbi:MAG TPA: aminopeptidase P family protein, partial [Bacteroidota bacterium]